jgi:serine/threonine/tyrosine protein kinase RAD53
MSINPRIAENASKFGYTLLKRVGSGTYGSVYEAKNKEGKTIALKIISRENPYAETDKLSRATKQEVEFLKDLSVGGCLNPNVVCYYDYHDDSGYYYIEMEYIEGMDFDKYVTMIKKKLPLEEYNQQILRLIKEITEGLKFIHSKGIIHNDIKVENIIVTKDGHVKIVDFGLGCKSTKQEGDRPSCDTTSGTYQYAAPEFISTYNTNINLKDTASDMWAFGITLYKALTGHFPFSGTTREEIFKGVLNISPGGLYIKSNNETIQEIVAGLTNDDADKRLTTDQVLNILKTSNMKTNMKTSNMKTSNIKTSSFPISKTYLQKPSINKELLEYFLA